MAQYLDSSGLKIIADELKTAFSQVENNASSKMWNIVSNLAANEKVKANTSTGRIYLVGQDDASDGTIESTYKNASVYMQSGKMYAESGSINSSETALVTGAAVNTAINTALSSALQYCGTLASDFNVSVAAAKTGKKKGDVYVASAIFKPSKTYINNWKDSSVEVGDLFIFDGSKFDIVNGENQVEQISHTLAWGSDVSIAKIDGTTITVKLPSNPNYQTGITVGASGTITNSSTTNPYIKIKDDSTHRSQIQLKGGGITSVSSDANGAITISTSGDNWVSQTNTISNLNSITNGKGIWGWINAKSTNKPDGITSGGELLSFTLNNGHCLQIASHYKGNGIYTRNRNADKVNTTEEWSKWKKLAFVEDIPTKLSQFTDDVVAGKYLPLSGGTIRNDSDAAPLTIASSAQAYTAMSFINKNNERGYLIYEGGSDYGVTAANWSATYTLMHSGNIGNYKSGDSANLGGYDISRFLLTTKRDYTTMDLNTIGDKQSIFTEIRTGEVTTSNCPISGYGALLSLKDGNSYAKLQILSASGSSDTYIRCTQGASTTISSNWNKVITDNNIGNYKAGDSAKLDGLSKSDFVRSYGDVGANYSKGNWVGYSYATEAHGGSTAGGVISAGNEGWGFQLNGSIFNDGVYYRAYSDGTFNTWRKLAFTSDIPTKLSQLTNNNQTFIGRTDGIVSNTDADNFTDSGAYLFQTGNGENNTNFPITGYGILNVFNSPYSNRTTNYVGQLLLGTYSIFYRTKVDTWSDWKQIALTSDIPTSLPASDVYAWAKAAIKPSYTASEVGALSTNGGTLTGNLTVSGTANSITAPKIVVKGSNHSATMEMYTSCLKIDKELMLTAGGTADICPGIACALKADRLQIKNLISENIILGSSNNGAQSNMSFNVQKYGSISNTTPASLTTLLTVNTTGNVGIGNTSPTEKLEVTGNVKANSFIKSGSSDSYVLLGGGGHKSLSDFTDTNYYHTRSYSSGLQISTGTGVSNMYVPYATTSQAGVVSTGSQTFAGAKTFSTVTASAFYEGSDERLKTFGEDIKVDFDELVKLRKSHFVFNNNPTKQEIGVSAQEVKELYPEIVNTNEEGYLSVDYAKLSVIALKAVDILYNQNKDFERRLKEIEDKLK